MTALEIGLVALAIIFSGAIVGMLFGRLLPAHHMDSDTRTTISVSTAVIGTMSALVIGLMVSSANTSFQARNAAVSRLSADIIQLDGLLRRYGPEAEPVRQALQQYTAMKADDLIPAGGGRLANTDNPASLGALVQVEDLILALKTTDTRQHALVEQANQLVSDIVAARWLLIQQNDSKVPLPFLVMIVMWLTILFVSFGLFTPRNPTAIIVLFLCAFALFGAVKATLDMYTPFGGAVRLSGFPLRVSIDPMLRALEAVSH